MKRAVRLKVEKLGLKKDKAVYDVDDDKYIKTEPLSSPPKKEKETKKEKSQLTMPKSSQPLMDKTENIETSQQSKVELESEEDTKIVDTLVERSRKKRSSLKRKPLPSRNTIIKKE